MLRWVRHVYTHVSLSSPKLTGNALLEDDKVFHLVRPADELDEMKSKRGSIKDKSMTKAITEIYLTRLLSVKVLIASCYSRNCCLFKII